MDGLACVLDAFRLRWLRVLRELLSRAPLSPLFSPLLSPQPSHSTLLSPLFTPLYCLQPSHSTLLIPLLSLHSSLSRSSPSRSFLPAPLSLSLFLSLCPSYSSLSTLLTPLPSLSLHSFLSAPLTLLSPLYSLRSSLSVLLPSLLSPAPVPLCLRVMVAIRLIRSRKTGILSLR